MGSQVRKSGRSLIDEELRASVPKQPVDERLAEMAETVFVEGHFFGGAAEGSK